MTFIGNRGVTSRRVLVAGLGIIALTATGCTGRGGVDSSGEPVVESTPSAMATASPKLPLDAYLFSRDELERLTQAQRILLTRCMRRFGFDFRPPVRTGGPELPNRNERRYGVADAATAAAYGYQVRQLPVKQQNGHTGAESDPAETTVLSGHGPRSVRGRRVPDGGCGQEARRMVTSTAPRPKDPDLAQRLAYETYRRSQRDSRVRAVFTRWSECMTGKGYTYRTPLDPPRDPRFVNGLPAKEIETAKADVACKERTNLVGVWSAVESAYQRRLVDQHRDELDKIRKYNLAQLRYAARTVEQTPR